MTIDTAESKHVVQRRNRRRGKRSQRRQLQAQRLGKIHATWSLSPVAGSPGPFCPQRPVRGEGQWPREPWAHLPRGSRYQIFCRLSRTPLRRFVNCSGSCVFDGVRPPTQLLPSQSACLNPSQQFDRSRWESKFSYLFDFGCTSKVITSRYLQLNPGSFELDQHFTPRVTYKFVMEGTCESANFSLARACMLCRIHIYSSAASAYNLHPVTSSHIQSRLRGASLLLKCQRYVRRCHLRTLFDVIHVNV